MTQILKTKRERLILRTVAAVQEINASYRQMENRIAL